MLAIAYPRMSGGRYSPSLLEYPVGFTLGLSIILVSLLPDVRR